ncbi:unnamed protein product [Timema podura]|uniref:CCHC-type domain-containing protein n=1 Tax=Timema podura TaxID=61482 RepID=A0ABN7NN25_TIMPD|nr:unnamed protein product [Timema podura]
MLSTDRPDQRNYAALMDKPPLTRINYEKELEGEPGKFYPIKADMTKEEDLLAAFKWVSENLDGVDVLVNNAGVAFEARLLGLPIRVDTETELTFTFLPPGLQWIDNLKQGKKMSFEDLEKEADDNWQVDYGEFGVQIRSGLLRVMICRNELIRFEAHQRALDSFLNGLVGDMSKFTRLAKPKTLREAVERAIDVVEAYHILQEKEENSRRRIFFIDKGKHCFKCKKQGHVTRDYRSGKGRQKSSIMERKQCFRCSNIGNLTHDYPEIGLEAIGIEISRNHEIFKLHLIKESDIIEDDWKTTLEGNVRRASLRLTVPEEATRSVLITTREHLIATLKEENLAVIGEKQDIFEQSIKPLTTRIEPTIQIENDRLMM